MLRFSLLFFLIVSTSGLELVQHIHYLCELADDATGVFSYVVQNPCTVGKRAIGSIVANNSAILQSFKQKCPDLLPLYSMKDAKTGNEVLLPYQTAKFGPGTIIGYVVKNRGDCGAWRQIEIRYQNNKKYSVPEMLPKIHHTEENMDKEFAPYKADSDKNPWIYFTW